MKRIIVTLALSALLSPTAASAHRGKSQRNKPVAAKKAGKKKSAQQAQGRRGGKKLRARLAQRPLVEIQTDLGRNSSERGSLANKKIQLTQQLEQAKAGRRNALTPGQVRFQAGRMGHLDRQLQQVDASLAAAEKEQRALTKEYQLRLNPSRAGK